MKYISVPQAAQKWNLTVRRVQELCRTGAIPGATRLGRAWMLPADAQRPPDGRTRQARGQDRKDPPAHLPIPRKNPFLIHTDLYHTPGTADQVVESFSEHQEIAKIVQAQFDYRRGEIEKLSNSVDYFLHEHVGFHATISAGILLSFCATWKGDLHLWRQARQHIYSAPCKDERDRQIVSFWLAIVDSTIKDTRSYPDWFEKGQFDCLPGDSYCTARVFYVKYMFIAAHELASGKRKFADVEGLGLMKSIPYIIEPMLSQAKYERTVVPESYLHLMLATVYHNLGDNAQAIPHIDDAIRLCLPDRLLGILIEYRTDLDGLLDDRLAVLAPGILPKFRELHKKMIAGWIKLHNQVLERNVSATLTVREREVAKLAAFGLSNTEIAQRLHIELSSVKQYIFSAMNKVGAEKRAELGMYI